MNENPVQPGPPAPSAGGNQPNMADIYPAAPGSVPTPPPQQPTTPLPTPESPKPSKSRGDGIKSVLGTVALFALAPIIALTLTAFAFQSYQVDGQSMETTLQNNDRLIVNKIPRTISRITHHAYIPKRGDIIVFNQAGLFDAGGNQEKQLIKRVIALPGEQIQVQNGSVTVYNKAHPEGFNPDKAGIYTITAPTTPGDVPLRTLGKDEIFVSGDNRGNSEDSRYFGPINASRIVGKLSFRVFPISNAESF